MIFKKKLSSLGIINSWLSLKFAQDVIHAKSSRQSHNSYVHLALNLKIIVVLLRWKLLSSTLGLIKVAEAGIVFLTLYGHLISTRPGPQHWQHTKQEMLLSVETLDSQHSISKPTSLTVSTYTFLATNSFSIPQRIAAVFGKLDTSLQNGTYKGSVAYSTKIWSSQTTFSLFMPQKRVWLQKCGLKQQGWFLCSYC